MALKICTYLIILIVCSIVLIGSKADVIMMGQNGMPSIIEDDEFAQDVILMPGMSNMIVNDDLVL